MRAAKEFWPVSGGDMGKRITSHDWSSTPLGPIEEWPQHLRRDVDVILPCPLPMIILWGEDLIQIYNDAYAELMGDKHPAGLGQKTHECWPEIVDFTEPLYRDVLSGKSRLFPDYRLELWRNGQVNECWFDLTYSPLPDEAGKPAGVLATAMETTARVEASRRHAARESLLSGITQGSQDLIAALDHDYRFLYFNDAYAAEYRKLWGRSIEIGDPLLDGLAEWPEEQEKARDIWSRALAGESFTITMEFGPPDATRMYELRFNPVSNDTGQVGAAHIFRDVTEKIRNAAALRESEERFRNMADYAPVMVWITEPDGSCSFLSQTWYDFTGQTPETALGFGWLEAVHPDDKAKSERIFIEANREQAPFRLEYRLRRHDGSYRWAIDSARPRFNSEGQFLGYIGSVIDIHDRMRAEEHRTLLIDELNHRVKNTLAIVQALAARTFDGSRSREESLSIFEGRLSALAQAHNLLAEESWHHALLGDVVQEVVASRSIEKGRFTAGGPDIVLKPKQAVTLAMALHELCTNAIKHGALRDKSGKVSFTWETLTGPDATAPDTMRLVWDETNGPAVATPTTRGFGSVMIEQALRSEFGATVTLDFRPDGLRCIVEAPLPQPDMGPSAPFPDPRAGFMAPPGKGPAL